MTSDDDPLAPIQPARRPGQIWRVRARRLETDEWETRLIEADEAAPSTHGILHIWNWSDAKKAQKRTIIAFAEGTWTSVEAVRWPVRGDGPIRPEC